MNTRIWLSLAHMSGKERDFIQEAFDTNWVVPLGPNVDGFERDLEQFLSNGVHVAALSAGTAAIHLGLVQLGVTQGDEVICQSFTFSASANPIAYQGGKPVFVAANRVHGTCRLACCGRQSKIVFPKRERSRRRLFPCICTACRHG